MSFSVSTVFRPLSGMLALAVAATLACAPAFAATTIYTTQASFLANVQAGSYTNTFTNSTFATALSYSYSSGGFGYTVTAAPVQSFGDDVYLSGTFIGNSYSNTSLIVTFTSGSPTAIGGNFFITNSSDAFVAAAPVTITLSDGTATTFTPGSVNDYRGFTSTTPIASLVLSAPGGSRYNTIDNFTVGRVAPVPEPATYALMACGLAVLGAAARRRRAG